MMKRNNDNRDIFTGGFGRLLAGVLVGMLLAACTETMDVERPKHGYRLAEGPFTLEVPIGVTENRMQTRAAEFGNFNISEMWVGLFDAVDHHIVGFGTVEGRITTATTVRVTIDNLFFDDDHPEAYVAAVVNYDGVEARLGAGEQKPLLDVLKFDVGSFEDFCNVAVDAVSAEKAVSGNHVLMTGFYTTSAAANFAVTAGTDSDGVLKFTPPSNIGKIVMFTYDENYKTFERKVVFVDNLQITSYIYLRPLFSHLTVNVELAAANLNRTGGVSWQLCNLPRYVYLIEHANIADCSSYTNETWPTVTPAASDLYADGYYSMTGFYDGTRDADAPYDVLAGDATTVSNGTYSFGFWHYENKHWGLPVVTTYNARETTFADYPDIFSSLCPSAEQAFNNNATYFVLRTLGTDGHNYDFRVHEGYATDINNSSRTAALRDFSTVRNTEYTYNIRISGTSTALSTMSTRTDADDFTVYIEVDR